MVHMRYGPTTVTYNALIFNFISVGDLHMCIKDYKDMMEKNCPPNVDMYPKIIKAFLKGRRLADALHMFDDMFGSRSSAKYRGDNIIYQSIVYIWTTPCCFDDIKKSRNAGCVISLDRAPRVLARAKVALPRALGVGPSAAPPAYDAGPLSPLDLIIKVVHRGSLLLMDAFDMPSGVPVMKHSREG